MYLCIVKSLSVIIREEANPQSPVIAEAERFRGRAGTMKYQNRMRRNSQTLAASSAGLAEGRGDLEAAARASSEPSRTRSRTMYDPSWNPPNSSVRNCLCRP